MRQLLLFRHAKTERDSPTGQDHDRELTERGRSDAIAVAQTLTRLKLVPDTALVSTARRAVETWELAAPHLSPQPKVQIDPDLYLASTAQLLHAVHGMTGSREKRLMIVAHNPGLHECALSLAADGERSALEELGQNMPTGAVAVLSFDIKDWNDVAFRSGHLQRLIVPRELRDDPKRRAVS